MAAMQTIALATGHESAFILPPTMAGADWRFRFFVPQHEMEMCGHATVGSLWAMRQWGRWTSPTARIETLSGMVDAEWDAEAGCAWVSQPPVQTQALAGDAIQRIAEVLRIPAQTILGVTNASTSRVKTLVRMPDVAALQALQPDFNAMRALCDSMESTGLYPFALTDGEAPEVTGIAARQFPRSSGYPEDAATGIAAAALWGYLATEGMVPVGASDAPIASVVRQGQAMGRPSAIAVRARFDSTGSIVGCWLSGHVAWSDEP
jgi:PhzF family phenazine biosynthesis protein